MLKLGYKASAEQFGPTDLLNFSCFAEEVGFDSVFVSDHFQPWKHTDGHAPNALAWLGALGARTSRAIIGTSVLTPTFRYHPSIVAQVFGTLGAMFPGRVVLGVGTGEVAERGAVERHQMAGRQGTARPAARGDRAHQQIVDRGPGHLRGPVLPHRKRHDLRQAEGKGAGLGRRLRPARGADGRAGRRGLYLHQRQGAVALHRATGAEGRGGRRQSAAATPRRSSA